MFGFLANLFTSSVISQVVPAAAPALKMLDIFEGAKFVSDAVTGKSFGESPAQSRSRYPHSGCLRLQSSLVTPYLTRATSSRLLHPGK